MQDANIGKHCSQCNRKDYIPYTCKKCNKTLCDEHYWQHPCVADQYQPKQYTGPSNNSQPSPRDNQLEYRCAVKACNKRLYTVNHFYCERCRRLVCLAHRLPEDHGCRDKKDDDKCQLI